MNTLLFVALKKLNYQIPGLPSDLNQFLDQNGEITGPIASQLNSFAT